jgi:hypothetical protein
MFDANIVLTSNIELNPTPSGSRRPSIRINPALDLRDPLLMPENHLDHFDDAPHHDRGDGTSQTPRLMIDCIMKDPLPRPDFWWS